MDKDNNSEINNENSKLLNKEINKKLEKNDNVEEDQIYVDLECETDEKIVEDKTEEKTIEIPESEYIGLKEQIEKNKKLANEHFERLQRAQADFENYKKLLQKEKQEYCKYAEKSIILKILDLIDEYKIALDALKKDIKEKEKIEGLEIIYNKFIEMLNKEEVKPIKSVGETFDPFIHEALLSENTDEYPEDTILEEIKRGYYFKDKVLRPALVKIAKNKERK